MAEKMLIDASHEEETRVVVVRGNRIEEFDFESQHKKQLRGNIYLAKVTRVEPSLQAAFVDYGGNRHGFLAFSEIHPDYYQIPLADRQALLQAEAEAERAEADEENDDSPAAEEELDEAEATAKEAKPKAKSRRSRSRKKPRDTDAGNADDKAGGVFAEDAGSASSDVPAGDGPAAPEETGEATAAEGDENGEEGSKSRPDEMLAAVEADSVSEEVDPDRMAAEEIEAGSARADEARNPRDDEDSSEDENGENTKVELVGAEDALEELPDRSQRKPRKQYRIQEVIKRRQILLVQVVKEERGNKGAALTTYLSLAGRYSVLMPNTARGGGISRKITNVPDRKRLKEIARELNVPQGMGVILRTAGANRTKAEIKRDFEYLMRLWENVRNLTLSSTAPTLVYEEGSLIKRSIRDLYNKDISEIVVSGEEGYREAKTFMKMLMPSHAKVVQPYRDIHPIFARSGIEAQLDRMLQPQVTLKSGGYIIINQTEALVAIDVNSGRSTKEHSIEDTALQTNLEAAEEVARQLRLRDLAGLIVIDFIDMEEKRNNRSVEKKLKDCLKHDRARIQVGRISHFGLLEMSRQRIRASVLESTTQVCEACGGTGHVRSKSSVALHCIRGIEEYLLKNTTHNITVRALPEIALYLLNQKRETIVDLEKRFGLSIVIEADDHVGTQHFLVERGEAVEQPVQIDQIVHYDSSLEDLDDIDEAPEEAEDEAPGQESSADDSGGRHKRKRRRRRRGGRSGESDSGFDDSDDHEQESETAQEAHSEDGDEDDEQRQHKRRRRGKRGGRRKRAGGDGQPSTADQPTDADQSAATFEPVAAEATASGDAAQVDAATEPTEAAAPESDAKPKERRRRRSSRQEEAAVSEENVATSEVAEAAPEALPEIAGSPAEAADDTPEAAETEKQPEKAEAAEAKPTRSRSSEGKIASEPVLTSTKNATDEKAAEQSGEKAKPKKAGWWQRRGFF